MTVRRSWVGVRRAPVVAAGTAIGAMALLLLAFSPIAGAGGSPPALRTRLAGQVPTLPAGASTEGAVPSTEQVSADVVLRLPDPAAVAAEASAVSTPGSPQYRQYLSAAQFAQQFGPSAATVGAARAWLASSGLNVGPTDPDGFIIPVTGSASAVEGAFATPLSTVRLSSGRTARVNTVAPSVPATVGPAVLSVVGLDDIAREVPQRVPSTKPLIEHPQAAPTPQVAGPQACSALASLTGAGGPYSMTQIAQAYGLQGLYAQGRTGAGQTIALYELEQFSASDVASFQACYGLHNTVSTRTVDSGPGGTSVGSGEAALDIEDAASFAPGANLIVYEGPNTGTGPLDVYRAIADQNVAKEVSTSWGICEAENVPAGTAQAEEQIFSQMATQGQGVMAAAGDEGSEDCLPQSGGLAVDDPASQQFVTGAGGTTLPQVGTNAGEVVWNNCFNAGASCSTSALGGAGGGGISSVWTAPSWQSGVQNSSSSSAPCHATSGFCREVPDVSGNADPQTSGYAVFWSGTWQVVGGTSAVAPLWSAVMADVSQGCSAPVGFAAPALYSLGAHSSGAFHDVTAGNNDYSQTNGGSYPATSGYDLASGWGSPEGLALAAGLQPPGGCPTVTGLSATGVALNTHGTITISGASLAGATAVHFGSAGNGTIISDNGTSLTVTTPALAGPPVAVSITVTTPTGTSASVAAGRFVFGTPHVAKGYLEVATDGGVFAYGDARFHGSMGGRPLDAPIVGIAATPDDGGYWEVASDGGIFAFGDARFHGSMGGRRLNSPVVGMATTPDGGGYWEVANDGGIFAFGDARFYGSMGGSRLAGPVVGIATTWDGRGYWEVGRDGGLFTFGDAAFSGSAATLPVGHPFVGMAPSIGNGGYWEVSSDGDVFPFGGAGSFGSMRGRLVNDPVVGMAATADGGGYWVVANDGGVFAFGDAPFLGSAGGIVLRAPVVAMVEA